MNRIDSVAEVRARASERNIPLIDLVEELRGLPRGDATRLYEPIDAGDLRGSETPFSEEGHAWVAEAVRRHLRDLPRVVALLDAPRPSAPGPATMTQ